MLTHHWRSLLNAGLWTFWIGCALVILINSIPDTALRFSKVTRANGKLLAPAGWGFFTRNPREEKLHVFIETDGQIRAMNGPEVRGWLLGGLDRRSRLLPIEVAKLEQQFAADAWEPCNGTPEACFAAARPHVLDNDMDRPVVCGEAAIIRREPTPWAWAKSESVRMPGQIARISVRCGDGV